MDMKDLLDRANAKLSEVESKNDELVKENAKFKTELSTLSESVKQGVKSEDFEALKNEIADLEVKLKKFREAPPVATKDQKEAIQMAAKYGIARAVRAKAADKLDNLSNVDTAYLGKSFAEASDIAIKALNLTVSGEGAESVAEVLSREIIERARESFPIVGEVRVRNMPRNLREEVLLSFPSVQLGIENVNGVEISETDTQRYGEVKNHIAKVNAKPRITDEAMYGSDLDVYGHLLTLLSEEVSRWLALQILFGDGADKNMRGMLSSKRIDFTVDGESFKPTFAENEADARNLDYYPVFGTGVADGLPATDKEIVDWLIDLETALPTVYLNNAKMTMNRRTLARFKKVRDANENPIFMPSYMGQGMSIMGYPVVLEEYMPNHNTADAPFMIFGDIQRAFSISPGDIDKTIVDPYTVDGCTVIKVDKEYFEMVGKNDAIIVAVTTTNS